MTDPAQKVREAVEQAQREEGVKSKETKTNEVLTRLVKVKQDQIDYLEHHIERVRNDYQEVLSDYMLIINAPVWKFVLYKARLLLGMDRYEARDCLQGGADPAPSEESA